MLMNTPQAGLPRTSTSSLQTALQTLGFQPTYHTITDLLPHARRHGPLWLKAMRTENKHERHKILAEIVKGYTAIVDGPGCFFVEDWVEMFPDAKVCLVCLLFQLPQQERCWGKN
jgi:hypothetical protein